MLLIHDDDQLPDVPNEAETLLVARLGTSGIKRIDENLRKHAQGRWLKVARVVANTVRDSGFSLADENIVSVHVRRVNALVESGAFESQGDLRKPRWSEVRIAQTGAVR